MTDEFRIEIERICEWIAGQKYLTDAEQGHIDLSLLFVEYKKLERDRDRVDKFYKVAMKMWKAEREVLQKEIKQLKEKIERDRKETI